MSFTIPAGGETKLVESKLLYDYRFIVLHVTILMIKKYLDKNKTIQGLLL